MIGKRNSGITESCAMSEEASTSDTACREAEAEAEAAAAGGGGRSDNDVGGIAHDIASLIISHLDPSNNSNNNAHRQQ